MSISIDLTGNESEEQMAELAWQTFAEAHPHEAYELDSERFWKYFHAKAPNVTRVQMITVLKGYE